VNIEFNEFCRTLVVNAPDAIIYADSKGLIQFWNHGAERLFGYSQQEVLGQTLDLIIPENLRKRHWDGYAQTMKTGRTRYGAGDLLSVPAQRKNGIRVSVEFTILPLHDRNSQICGIAAVLRDVSKQYQEIKQLRAEVAARHIDQNPERQNQKSTERSRS